MLTTLFLPFALLFLALESCEDDSDESDDDGSGSGFTLGSCVRYVLNYPLIKSFDLCLVESYIVESQYFQYFGLTFPALKIL